MLFGVKKSVMNGKYVHLQETHNLKAPRQIVPEIMRLLNPSSVVDVGCGLGTFLYVFKEHGVLNVLGIDGPWVDRKLLQNYLTEDEFAEKDLEKEFTLDKQYDLVISLEVAEHLSPESADRFVKNLIGAGKLILFSAAIPMQGGQRHVNEQWPTYWEEKFAKHDYVVHDVLRPIFWNNPDIFWWYKQNMVLITPKDYKLDADLAHNPIRNLVHYDLFIQAARNAASLRNGELHPSKYLRLLYLSLARINYIDQFKKLISASKKQ